MKKLAPLLLACLLVLTGCFRKTDEEQVDGALQQNAFFRSLGAIPRQSGDYRAGGGLLDGDTSLPVHAWRSVKDPTVNYEITVQKPFAWVDFDLAWPCTLYVVYTDLPDTSIRDTVVKPAPLIAGTISMGFEFKGDEWQLTELSPCDARFDSAVGVIDIDSLQVSVRRGGQTVPYPTLASTGRLPLFPYAYTFQAGDSVDLRLWETHTAQAQFTWAYLHGPPTHGYSPFQYDTLSGSFHGTWTVGHAETSRDGNWVWFEVIDLDDALLSKHGPDRSALWGVGYVVEQ
ncbi:hypothetical protein FJY71_00155 [candidate division WOR-3 bacterium]|nr:hypothetical protein [candidate division WOR-3 bacterium]